MRDTETIRLPGYRGDVRARQDRGAGLLGEALDELGHLAAVM